MRLAKWFTTMSPKAKLKITKDVTQLVLARRTRMCNFLEYKDSKVVYRRYASLFFCDGISQGDNELVTLEIIHRYVEVLDRYFETSASSIHLQLSESIRSTFRPNHAARRCTKY